MTRFGIIAAMEEELQRLLQAMDQKTSQNHAHMIFNRGRIYEQEVVVVQSGIGKVNAAMATVILIESYKVEAIINSGAAGALSDDLTIGDIVVSKRLAYHDADARIFGYEMGQVPQMPLYYPTDPSLNKQLLESAERLGLRARLGEIVTSDSFISNSQTIERIKKFFPQADVTEMEGAAIAQVCYQYKLPCTVVRAISDNSNKNAALSFDDFIVEAGQKSAQMLIQIFQ